MNHTFSVAFVTRKRATCSACFLGIIGSRVLSGCLKFAKPNKTIDIILQHLKSHYATSHITQRSTSGTKHHSSFKCPLWLNYLKVLCQPWTPTTTRNDTTKFHSTEPTEPFKVRHVVFGTFHRFFSLTLQCGFLLLPGSTVVIFS